MSVVLEEKSRVDVRRAMAVANRFPTAYIPYPHTVIVERYWGDRVLVVDPLAEPWAIPLPDFLDGWAVYDQMAIIIW